MAEYKLSASLAGHEDDVGWWYRTPLSNKVNLDVGDDNIY